MINSLKIVDVFYNSATIGKLALTTDNLTAFEYDKDYIGNGVSVSPFYLPLKPGVFIAKREPFNGLFGVFNDSLPDGWGTLLTDRILLKNKIALTDVNILDRLSLIGSNGMGALSFKPEWEIVHENNTTDLNKIANEVKLILQNNYEGNLEDLYIKGGSSGGARPKILIKIIEDDWIIKFKATSDPENIGQIEYDYSLAAKKCGLNVSETKLFEGKYFGTKRFDKIGNERFHIHSASGLLNASYRFPSLDYTELIKATFALTKNIKEALMMFRIMVFNVLTHNRDDHAKNFAFILKNNEWKLSPSYDLVLSNGFNGQHTTTIAGIGNPRKKDLFEVAKLTGLPEKNTIQIFDEVYENTRELVNNHKII